MIIPFCRDEATLEAIVGPVDREGPLIGQQEIPKDAMETIKKGEAVYLDAIAAEKTTVGAVPKQRIKPDSDIYAVNYYDSLGIVPAQRVFPAAGLGCPFHRIRAIPINPVKGIGEVYA